MIGSISLPRCIKFQCFLIIAQFIVPSNQLFAGSTAIQFSKNTNNFPSERFQCTKNHDNFEVLNLKGGWIVRIMDGVCIDRFCETHLVREETGCQGGILSQGSVYYTRRPGHIPGTPYHPDDIKRVFIQFNTPAGIGGMMLEKGQVLNY